MTNLKKKLMLFSLILILGISACNLPVRKDNLTGEEIPVTTQEPGSFSSKKPFEQVSAEEFFQLCENSGGSLKEHGDGWACDLDGNDDIVCAQSGDCNPGTVPENHVTSYSFEPPELGEEEAPSEFVEICQDNGGAVFKWNEGVGCDREDDFDRVCGPNGSSCGTAWLVEMTVAVNVIKDPQNTGGGENVILTAPMFETAFATDTSPSDEVSDTNEETFVMEKKSIKTGDIRDGTSNTPLVVAKADDSDEGGDDDESTLCGGDNDPDPVQSCEDMVEVFVEICELSGGFGDANVDHEDPNAYYTSCSLPNMQDWICDAYGCYDDPEDKGSYKVIDFGTFEEAFGATDVYVVLTGASDINPGFRGLNENWTTLYTQTMMTAGIIAPNNFVNPPGTVSIIAPNNIIFDGTSDPGKVLINLSPSKSPFTKTECGILRPPLCFPEMGLLIPITEMTYFINPSSLLVPEKFTWVDQPAPSEASAQVVTPEQNVNCRLGPGLGQEVLGFFLIGDLATPLAQNRGHDWILIENDDGTKCWVWRGGLVDNPELDELPEVSNPIVSGEDPNNGDNENAGNPNTTGGNTTGGASEDTGGGSGGGGATLPGGEGDPCVDCGGVIID